MYILYTHVHTSIYIYKEGEKAYDLDGDELGLGDRDHARLSDLPHLHAALHVLHLPRHDTRELRKGVCGLGVGV